MSAPTNAGDERLSLATMNVHALEGNSGISSDQGKTSKKRQQATLREILQAGHTL
jgi:hypothetical protein